ncbi:helix-turn-helix domain-containing protein [Streptomyces sp. bgisy091]|uniref:helix-turn-helix domain-containing protein n=1 Tax=Streptomyces sp. bgisy091 TaxID=3413778 RepID=UPI003D7359DD
MSRRATAGPVTGSRGEERDRWRNGLAGVLGAVRVAPAGGGVGEERPRTTQVGFVRVLDLVADTLGVTRTWSHTAEDPGGFVAFGIQESGTVVLTQGDRTLTAGPGELFVWDATRPYGLDWPEAFAARIVRMPVHALPVAPGGSREVTAAVVPAVEGLGAALRGLLGTLVAGGGPRSAAIADLSAESVTNLFCALVAERAEPPETGSAGVGPRGHLLARIRGHIEDHLAEPELSPGAVAQAHHISVRYLHRLFEAEGITVARYIRQRRLARCAQELARRSPSPPTVSSIAQRWGFVNPAHFSRTFRDAHGHSPVEWRALRTSAGQDTSVLLEAGPRA